MNSRILQVVAVFLASATLLPAGMQTRRQPVAKNKTAPPAEMMRMPWVAPLFVEDQDFTSTLVLVNSTAVNGPAEVTLRDVRGAIITTQNVLVQARSDLRLPIEPLLRRAHAASINGSITVMPTSGNVAAQLSLTYRKQPVASYIDEELSMPMPDSSPTLRAVAENSHGSPLVVVTSTASTLQHITIRCLPTAGQRMSKTLDLAPSATILIQACRNAAHAIDDIEYLAAAPDDNSRGAFGVEVTSDGPAGEFAAFGLVAHHAEGAEYFSALTFVDPMMLHSSNAVYTGVPVGTIAILPSGTYKPAVALTNFGTTDAHVQVSIATTTDGKASKTLLTTLAVPAGHSLMADLPVYSNSSQLQNSFVLAADTGPGNVITKLIALGDGPLHEVEFLGKDDKDPRNGGHHPWSLHDGSDATLLLFNRGSDTENVQVRVGFPTGVWEKDYSIESFVTLAISIHDLVQQQMLDDQGRTLPSNVGEGAISWSTERSNITGRLLQSNVATAMARSFSCGLYSYVGDPVTVANANKTTTAGNTTPVDVGSATGANWESDNYYCDSFGQVTGGNYGHAINYYWSDDGPYYNLSPATSTSYKYSVTAASPGAESVLVAIEDIHQCGAYGSGSVTVKPGITSISPSHGAINTSASVTINGGFGASATVAAGSNITVTVNSVSSSQIQATFAIADNATAGSVNVTVTSNGIASDAQTFTIDSCDTDRNNIITEYSAYSVNLTPACANFTQTASSQYFAFSAFNTGDYAWALVKAPLTAPSNSDGLDAWRAAYGAARTINSAYRNPAHNAAVGGAAQSRHMYGDAVDLRNQSGTQNEWNAMVLAAQTANADFIEPQTGPCGLGCTHADWRYHGGGYQQ
jgi:hypothetical protein